MGFPTVYPKDFIPVILMNALSLLGIIRALILTLLRAMGHSYILEPDFSMSEPEFYSPSASLIQELLPVMKFGEVGPENGPWPDPPERCAVCLYDFEDDQEIRRLTNCGHIFHKGCVDRWMEHDQRTCPLCRALFIPDDMVEGFNHKIWASHDVYPEFGQEFSPINSFL